MNDTNDQPAPSPVEPVVGPTEHPYYCENHNFYCHEVREVFETVTEFLDAFEPCDIDLNLVFRFDVHCRDNGTYSLDISMMLQRKGIYKPIHCRSYNQSTEGARLTAYLQKHFDRNLMNWKPFIPPNPKITGTAPTAQVEQK